MVKRGDPGIKETVNNARDEMNRFTAYYRRNNKVAGAASFSTLYTAISTLSGHFQNYGPEYPVPAKRQKVRTNRLCIRTGTQFQHRNTHTPAHTSTCHHTPPNALSIHSLHGACDINPKKVPKPKTKLNLSPNRSLNLRNAYSLSA